MQVQSKKEVIVDVTKSFPVIRVKNDWVNKFQLVHEKKIREVVFEGSEEDCLNQAVSLFGGDHKSKPQSREGYVVVQNGLPFPQ